MVIVCIPRMPRVTICKHLPIGAKRFVTQILDAVVAQNPIIAAVLYLLGQHPFYFIIR